MNSQSNVLPAVAEPQVQAFLNKMHISPTTSTLMRDEVDFQDTHPADICLRSQATPSWFTEVERQELPLLSCGKRDITSLVISKIEKAYPLDNPFSSEELTMSNRRRLFSAYVFLLKKSKAGWVLDPDALECGSLRSPVWRPN